MLQIWLDQLSQICLDTTDAIAFLAPNEKGWECLCGFYRKTALNSLQIYLKTGRKSFQNWLSQEKILPIQIQNNNIFFYCNTPNDYIKINKQKI